MIRTAFRESLGQEEPFINAKDSLYRAVVCPQNEGNHRAQPSGRKGTWEMVRTVRVLARRVAWLGVLVWAGASGASASVVPNPVSISFGNVAVGLEAVRALTLTNDGTQTVQILSMTFTYPNEYGIGDGVFPISLTKDANSKTYSIVFRPAQAAAYNGSITVNFSNAPNLVIPVTGQGTATLGKATLNTTLIPYGNVALGTTSTWQVKITNVGSAAFSVTNIATYAPFSIIGFSQKVTLQPGQSLSFQVGFSPFNLGAVTGGVTVFYDSLPPAGIDLTGTGIAPAGLAITTFPTLPSATQGFPYLATLQATGGTPPYSWHMNSGSVQGLTFSSSAGSFGGSVSSSVLTGKYSFVVEVQDSSTPPEQATATLMLRVGPPTGANCDIKGVDVKGTHTPVLALNDLGTGTYQGFEGGLYPNGANVNPQQAAGVSIAQGITPLDANGNPDPTNGIIGLVSFGQSTTQQPFSQFIPAANADPAKNPHVVVVNGALGGETALRLTSDHYGYMGTILDYLLPFAGVTPQQVEVVWVNAIDPDLSGFPGNAQLLQGQLESLAQVLKTDFPNVQLAYLGSLNYTGYAQGGPTENPEPNAYESGFADKWTIQDQINGDADLNYNPADGPVMAPWMGWAYYYWANGLLARSDGTTWSCQDLKPDGTHPSYPSGQQKVAYGLLNFLKTDTTAVPWFVAPGH
jgi:hypothetical protein